MRDKDSEWCYEFSPSVCAKNQGVTHSPDCSGKEMKEHKAVPLCWVNCGVCWFSAVQGEGCLSEELLLTVPPNWLGKENGRQGADKEWSPHWHIHYCSKARLREKGGTAGRSLQLLTARRWSKHPRLTVLGEVDLFILSCKIWQLNYNSQFSLGYHHEWRRGPCPLSAPLEWHSPSCCTKYRWICSVKVNLPLPLPTIYLKKTNFVPKK